MGKPLRLGVMRQFGAHHILVPHKEDPNVILPCGKNRALNFRLGGAVRAHGIDRNGNGHRRERPA